MPRFAWGGKALRAERLGAARAARRGISLLEIMISIGVVGIGLLGVAALLPLAHFKAAQGVREDRKSLFGKRVFREFFVREFHRPGSMATVVNVPGLAQATQPRPYWIQLGFPVPIYDPINGALINQTYCFDPHWVAVTYQLNQQGNPVPISNQFPDVAPGPTAPIRIPRVTVLKYRPERLHEVIMAPDPTNANSALQSSASLLTQQLVSNPIPLSVPQADEIFRLRDDVVVQQLANPAEGSYAVVPLPGGPNTFVQRQFLRESLGGSLVGVKSVTQGSFSWMATLVPESKVGFNTGGPIPYPTNRFLLSLVIFHQRDVSGRFREEVAAEVVMNQSIMQGGTKQIVINEIVTDPLLPDSAGAGNAVNVGVRHIRQGDWVAVMQNPLPASGIPNFIQLKWYQVIGADELETNPQGFPDATRELTLSGPDWSLTPNQQVYAIYLRNVVAVYEKTVELQ